MLRLNLRVILCLHIHLLARKFSKRWRGFYIGSTFAITKLNYGKFQFVAITYFSVQKIKSQFSLYEFVQALIYIVISWREDDKVTTFSVISRDTQMLSGYLTVDAK